MRIIEKARRITILGALVFVAASAFAQAGKPQAAIDGVVAEGALLEKIGSGYKHAEGPAWKAGTGLIFSDVTGQIIYLFSDGQVKLLRESSGFANGNAFDKAGNLYTAQHDRRVTRTDRTGKISTLVDRFDGKRLNSPNDLVVN